MSRDDQTEDTTLLSLLWRIDGSPKTARKRVRRMLATRRVRLVGILRDQTDELVAPLPIA